MPHSEGAEISRVLSESAAAWSAGDLDTFMACYEDSPETLYVNGMRVVTGFAAIYRMYADRFASYDAAARGALAMNLLEVKPLGRDHAFAAGRYTLTRGEAYDGPSAGPFSLVFHKTPAGWRIAADHTL